MQQCTDSAHQIDKHVCDDFVLFLLNECLLCENKLFSDDFIQKYIWLNEQRISAYITKSLFWHGLVVLRFYVA